MFFNECHHLHRNHVNGDFEPLAASTKRDTSKRADIRKVTAPGDGDVPVARQEVVGGISIHPAGFIATKDRDPGMGGIRT
jgi:hypothetical protein